VSQASKEIRKPVLVVGHGLRSVPALQVVEAASGLCDIVWVIDESIPENATTSRLLKKFGAVVNVAGLSTSEIAALVRQHSPDGMVAYRDEDVVPFALLGAELGLEFHSPEVALTLVDKFLQREALRKAGVPSPRCWELPADRSPGAVGALGATVEFPAVIKPRSGSGGQYTVPVADEDELVRQVALLPPQAGGARGMFVEQYLASVPASSKCRFADYVSVESLVAGEKISHLAVNGRFPLAEPFRETGFFIPADLAGAERVAVLEMATAALAGLKVRTGGFHTEIKLTPDGPRVLEVNGRLGGGVPEMLFQASGESLMALSMRLALGEAVERSSPIPCTRIGWRFLVQPPATARRVVSIEGLDRLAQLTGVNSVFLNRVPGDAIDLLDGTRHYIYSVYGVSPDYDEMVKIDRFIHEEVVIVYD
jgi:biotin carboxylase